MSQSLWICDPAVLLTNNPLACHRDDDVAMQNSIVQWLWVVGIAVSIQRKSLLPFALSIAASLTLFALWKDKTDMSNNSNGSSGSGCSSCKCRHQELSRVAHTDDQRNECGDQQLAPGFRTWGQQTVPTPDPLARLPIGYGSPYANRFCAQDWGPHFRYYKR